MSVNIATYQMAMIAKEALQEGASLLAEKFNLSQDDVQSTLISVLDYKAASIAEDAYRRHRNSAIDAIDDDKDVLSKLVTRLTTKQKEAQLEEDTLAVVFWSQFNGLMNEKQYSDAQELINSLPECALREKAKQMFIEEATAK